MRAPRRPCGRRAALRVAWFAAPLLLGAVPCRPQGWIRRYSPGGYVDVAARNDGTLLMAAGSNPSAQATPSRLRLMEIDGRGRVLRAVASDGPSSLNRPVLVGTSDGGCLVAADFPPVAAAWIARLKPGFEPQWELALQDVRIHDGVETPDGGFLLAGWELQDRSATARTLVVRIGSAGTVQWARSFDAAEFPSSHWIRRTGSGGCLVLAGISGVGSDAATLMALDADGNVAWQRAMGTGESITARGLVSRQDGGALVAFGRRTASYDQTWIVHVADDGTVLTSRSYRETGWYVDGDVLAAPSDGAYVAERMSYNGSTLGFRALRLDADGAGTWFHHFDFGEWPLSNTGQAFAGGDSGILWLANGEGNGTSIRLLRLDASGVAGATCPPADRGLFVTVQPDILTVAGLASRDVTLVPLPWPIRLVPMTAWETELCPGAAGPPGEVSPPAAATPLTFRDEVTLDWEDGAFSGSDVFCLYRGEIANLRAGDGGACLQSDLALPAATDVETPPPGRPWFYLVAGRNGSGDGPLGMSSAGLARVPSAACP